MAKEYEYNGVKFVEKKDSDNTNNSCADCVFKHISCMPIMKHIFDDGEYCIINHIHFIKPKK